MIVVCSNYLAYHTRTRGIFHSYARSLSKIALLLFLSTLLSNILLSLHTFQPS